MYRAEMGGLLLAGKTEVGKGGGMSGAEYEEEMMRSIYGIDVGVCQVFLQDMRAARPGKLQ